MSSGKVKPENKLTTDKPIPANDARIDRLVSAIDTYIEKQRGKRK